MDVVTYAELRKKWRNLLLAETEPDPPLVVDPDLYFRLRYVPLADDGKGGADFSLVTLGDMGKPSCTLHGAMNKVSPSPPGYWRCIALSGPKINPCRAACMERAL